MLSYQHSYHAGNFADVVKHVTLTRLLNYMTQKDKPMLYLDTHAGRGKYDLHGAQACKTQESVLGIGALWEKRDQLGELFSPYLNAIQQVNSEDNSQKLASKVELRYYPGSVTLALQALRKNDRLVCYERHSTEYQYLSSIKSQGKKLFSHHNDGVSAMHALLPPIEKRSLVFIDPSFEIKTDYRTLPQDIAKAYRQFSTGVYCLWYPIIDNKTHEQLLRRLTQISCAQTLRIEWYNTHISQFGMTGCGLWIINPPYVLKSEMEKILYTLRSILNPNKSRYIIE